MAAKKTIKPNRYDSLESYIKNKKGNTKQPLEVLKHHSEIAIDLQNRMVIAVFERKADANQEEFIHKMSVRYFDVQTYEISLKKNLSRLGKSDVQILHDGRPEAQQKKEKEIDSKTESK